MEESDFTTPPVFPTSGETQRSHQPLPSQQLLLYAISQEISNEELSGSGELDFFNPLVMARRFEALESKVRKGGKEEESKKTEEKGQKVAEIRRIEGISERFQRGNYELQARILLILRSRILNSDTKDEILKKVLETYSDYSLADEAFDFLLETSDGELKERISQAKKELNDLYAREIRAGRNMGAQARAFSTQGLGDPNALRDMYRDITGNPREPPILFEELSKLFSYSKMKTVIDFILHALGSDLKSKGPSISRAELHRLMSEARTLQAILGIYRFFKSRMQMITAAFLKNQLLLPVRLSFELLAQQFMKFLQERYPSSDKALLLALHLGVSEEIAAQIILYTQMRDAVRQVAPKLFKSDQHRQDVLTSLMEALEELDEKLEEKEDEEQKEKEEEEKENG
jgi:type III secretion protein W